VSQDAAREREREREGEKALYVSSAWDENEKRMTEEDEKGRTKIMGKRQKKTDKNRRE